MNIALWLGFVCAVMLLRWAVGGSGLASAFSDFHGVVMVLGGMGSAMLINCSFGQLAGAIGTFIRLFLPSRLPSVDNCIAEVVRLSRLAQREGGILALQGESRDFADGFLHRAIVVAISAAESGETRRIMEAEMKQLRAARQEDANVFRTMGVLAPMFGLLGTLLGMVNLLETMSDPTKAASAMAMALSSAFFGIGIANFVCVPVSGQIRLASIKETLIYEILLDGALDIAAGKAPYLVEMHLASYSRARRQELEAGGGAAAAAPPAP